MSRRGVVGMFGACLLGPLLAAEAQEPASGGPAGLSVPASHKYAPALWLAQEEPFYPVLPHPFAFDGIDNDRDGLIDLADEDEVGAFGRKALDETGGLAEHSDALRWVFGRLLDIRICAEQAEQRAQAGGSPEADPLGQCAGREIAKNRDEQGKRSRAAVPAAPLPKVSLKGFEVCGNVWGTGRLRCGPDPVVLYGNGSGRQLSARDIGVPNLKQAAGLFGIQYWMYYPWDAGHINDGEHISIFYWPDTSYTTRNVKAVLGAGHEGHTANNILVASTDDTAKTVSPRSLPRHMPFLVELGKHASAPDFNCNGRFDVGVDANVGVQGAWGSRDVMVSIDKKNFGPFRGWMSVERDGSGFLVEESIDDDPALRADWEQGCPEFTRGSEIFRRISSRDRVGFVSGVAVVDHRYRLVAAEVFEDLYRAVCTLWGGRGNENECTLPPTDQKMGDPEAVLAVLRAHQTALWGKGREPASIGFCAPSPGMGNALCVSEPALAAMREWLRRPGKLRARRDVWTHSDFGHFHKDFKRHLFKQLGFGASFWVENGVSKLGLVARVSGFPKLALPDSSLDIVGSIEARNDPVLRRYGDDQWRLSNVMVNYNAYRTSYQGFYVGASYNLRTPEYLAATVIGPTSEEAVVIRRSLSNSVSLRVGAAVGVARGRARITLRAGVHGPITRFVVEDGLAHRSRTAAGIHAGLEVVVGVRNEKHPLMR